MSSLQWTVTDHAHEGSLVAEVHLQTGKGPLLRLVIFEGMLVLVDGHHTVGHLEAVAAADRNDYIEGVLVRGWRIDGNVWSNNIHKPRGL